ncbi:GNAT family N-acetyltransferase [Roseomonas elaeocarpi]|uniref:GNAT family N-acetyltransferase n=1 Tax=Roseomonas elaeocarpi TaxID=907779 RepID=A0ABV6K0N2_9PROT
MVPGAIGLTPFEPSHLDGAHRLSREAGWPHRREDWATVLSLGQGTVALREGRVAGTVMVTPLGRGATVSLVIVDAALRGHGLGRRLMEAAIAACGAREARLIATPEGLPLYRKLGFRDTHEVRQHQGIVSPASGARAEAGVEWAGEGDLAAIGATDAAALELDRAALLQVLARDGRIAVLRRGGRVLGYGALRPFGRGEVVGPVVAANEGVARAILGFLIDARAGAFVRVDTPAYPTLGPWLAERGLVEVDGGVAMRRPGSDPVSSYPDPSTPAGTPAFQVFALASQALG